MNETVSRVNESRRTKKYERTPPVDKPNVVVHSTGGDVGVKAHICRSYKLIFSGSGTSVPFDAALPPPLDRSGPATANTRCRLFVAGRGPPCSAGASSSIYAAEGQSRSFFDWGRIVGKVWP
jgi:hypothetical protein